MQETRKIINLTSILDIYRQLLLRFFGLDYYIPLNKANNQKVTLKLEYSSLTLSMSQQYTDDNSLTEERRKKTISKESVDEGKGIDRQLRSKSKRGRKTATVNKNNIDRIENKPDNQSSIGKQVKLTQFWKCQNGLNESASKINIPNHEIAKKKLQDEIQEKNKQILRLKAQRDNMQKRYNSLEDQKINYQYRAKQTIKKSLLQVAAAKRSEKYRLNSQYGYFTKDKDKPFAEGPYIRQIRKKIQIKKNEKQDLRFLSVNDRKDKQLIQFRSKFIQKQINELQKVLVDRLQVVEQYKKRIKFSQIEYNCHYARLGWPTIGKDNKYQVLELVGSGGFGQVYKCYDLVENCYVALKQNRFVSNSKGKFEQEMRQNFLRHVIRQVEIQKNLNHPNIAKFYEIIKNDDDVVSFIMEYCDGPDLSHYFKQNECLSQNQAKQIIRQLVCAINYLSQQENKVIHYDLKPSNIMFNRGVVKIVDFGLCKQMDTGQTRMNLTSQGTGTYWYLPPQTFQQDAEVSCKVDVWSIGVIFYELLYGRRPFGHEKSQKKIFHQGIIANATKVQFPQRSPKNYKITDDAKKFITQLLKHNQKQRLSPAQAYDHSYFK